MLEPVDEDHLDCAGDRDRGKSADHARELGSDQDCDQHGKRRELHGPAVDDRLEHVVLELLVDDEEDQHDHAGGGRVEERDRGNEDRGDRGAGKWDQVEDRHEQPERDRIRNADAEQHGGRDDAGDQADRQVAGHVTADRPVDVVPDLAPARLLLLGQEAVQPLDPRRPLEQHEQGQERDRERRDHAP